MDENKEIKQAIKLHVDPSITSIFSDTVTVSLSGESVRLIFSQKLASLGTEANNDLPTHKVVSSVELTLPFFMRMIDLLNNAAGQIKGKEKS
ncbi:MAG: hypothetical protein PHQ11_15520 [Paludibacter sp.]|nr:hypothetical protein [Paludibacter sp.]